MDKPPVASPTFTGKLVYPNQEYYLWDTRGGWLSHGPMSTDVGQARQFPHDEMLETCKLYRQTRGAFALLPIEVTLAREIMK